MKYLLTTLLVVTALQDFPSRQDVGQALKRQAEAQELVDEKQAEADAAAALARSKAAELNSAKNALEGAKADAERVLAEYIASLAPTPTVPPPVGGTDPLRTYLASLPFADKMPVMPDYRVPTLADCDWTVRGGVYTSETLGTTYSVKDAFRKSRASGDDTVTIGIWDTIERAVVGGLWDGNADHSITDKDSDGNWAKDLRIELVGLDDQCEVGASWTTKYGMGEYLGLFNIGIRGPNDSFIVRANDGIETLIIDGCWLLAHKNEDGSLQTHASGIHMDKWRTLIVRRMQWRGERPTDPGVKVSEHPLYLKSSRGQTWLVENDLRGGNRSGFQIRPGADTSDNIRPAGPVIIAKNVINGYGWNHGSDGSSYDGGAAITVWANPDSNTFIVGNEVLDAKYACLVVSGQGPHRNWLNAEGYPIKEVWVWDNVFENKRGDRGAVAISSVGTVHWGPNEVRDNGRITFNNQWGMENNGIANGTVKLYDDAILGDNVWTYDGENRRMSREELLELIQ